MVRLKDYISLANIRVLKEFQFLMVRLKAKFYIIHYSKFVISIPYGAIKSKILYYSLFQVRHFNSLWCD